MTVKEIIKHLKDLEDQGKIRTKAIIILQSNRTIIATKREIT